MKTPAKKPLDNPEQSQRFVETAKALGSDESGKSFERALKTVMPSLGKQPKKTAAPKD